jgi:hypothetical protein
VSNDPQELRITPTPRGYADVSAVTLRGEGNSRTRLVFIPMLVDNATHAEATIRGTFAYQRKRVVGQWEEPAAIKLNQLLAGEGVRLELSASEVSRLYRFLAALYRQTNEHGIPQQTEDYLLIEARTGIRELLDAAAAAGDPQGVLAVVDWINSQDPDTVARHFRSRSEALAKLDNTLGVARLSAFVDEAERLLENSAESNWQVLLQNESWAIGQLYSEPVVLLQGQAYVGGKNIRNRKGNIADFLYRNSITNNCIIVEIKRPDTPLVVDDSTSRNNIMNISKEVTGAVQQVLQNRYSIAKDYSVLVGDAPEFSIFSPRLLLVVGNSSSLDNEEKQKSFELYRGQLRDVDVVTCDELVEKAKTVLRLLRSDVAQER